MKRLITAIVVFLVLMVLLLPLSSRHLLRGLYGSRYTNENIRVDVSLQVSKPDSLKIISDNNVQKESWNKSGNTMMVQDCVDSKWQKYTIRAQAIKSGEMRINLRGPYVKVEDEVYPLLVDYRGLKVNGKPIFYKRQARWHDDPYLYELRVKDHEVVNISFEARRHHFRISDVTKVYKTNLWILLATALLSVFISWKASIYIVNFNKVGHVSCVDIGFVCMFFGLLFAPMRNISTAERSEQENRVLSKKPVLFQNTGGGYNLRYGKEAERWFNDRFFGRALALKLDRLIKYNIDRVYKKGNALYIPDNNWMFRFEKQIALNEKHINEIAQELNLFNQFCKQNRIKLYVLLVPFKNAIYHEILEREFAYHVEDNQDYVQYDNQVNQLRQKTGIPIIYPYNELRKAREEDYVFFKQSHHWTEWGAYQGYLALMKEITRDFPDIQTVSLSDYMKFTSHKIRDDWWRDFNTGHTTRILGFDPQFAENHLLLDDYNYYDNQSSNDLTMNKTDPNVKFFVSKKRDKFKILLIGNSQNENLLQFLPYSARELKYIRFNLAKLSSQEQPKIFKYYKKDIIDYKPDILVYCISAERSKDFLPNLTKK